MSKDIVPERPSKARGKISTTNTVLNGTGPEELTLDVLRSYVGQDVQVTYRVNMSINRTFVGSLIGLADRASTANPPDLVIKNRSTNLVLVNTARLVSVRSTLEGFRMSWDMNPMELARVAYEAWKDASAATREWVELPHAEKEMWLASSEAVRHAVNLGA
jgi:hypothetical protein